jgi:hypothetical protein
VQHPAVPEEGVLAPVRGPRITGHEAGGVDGDREGELSLKRAEFGRDALLPQGGGLLCPGHLVRGVGLLMGMPAGLIYLVAACARFADWLLLAERTLAHYEGTTRRPNGPAVAPR